MGERSKMTNWQAEKQWSDRFMAEIKQIISEHFDIGVHRMFEASVIEDMERNTDLVVWHWDLELIRIACRVRRHKYLCYGDEFTIRSGHIHNVQTENGKVREGYGDYFFYGFADETETKLCRWLLGDLKVLRQYITQNLLENRTPWRAKNNNDGTSFWVFRHQDVPNFVIARHTNETY